MKFTLSWLKEHLDTDEPVEKLADKLTMIGLEVEQIVGKIGAIAERERAQRPILFRNEASVHELNPPASVGTSSGLKP